MIILAGIAEYVEESLCQADKSLGGISRQLLSSELPSASNSSGSKDIETKRNQQ